MPVSSELSPPTVFISYAHESDALGASVTALADWLRGRGCEVLTDHAYVHRPPTKGWQVWMADCIREADIVLIVCTPGLKARYEKTSSPIVGRGATYEGAIVTQHIYNDAMCNTKFYPVVPDGGSSDDVPTFLEPWSNGHLFPSGNEGIAKMIFDGAGGAGPKIEADEISGEGDSGPWPIFDDHQRLAAEKLRAAPGAYQQRLHHKLESSGQACSIPDSAESTVRWFCECPADEDQILALFTAVREALDAVPSTKVISDERGRVEEAASALFFLAACRLVNRAAHLASVATGNNRHVVLVPRSEHILCGVIATALFGGELRLTTSEQPDVPAPEYLFEVHVPVGADERVSDFERAAYVAILSGDRKETEVSIDAGPLSERERSKLKARIRTIRERKHRSLALVVHGLTQAQASASLPVALQVPVLLPDTEATRELFGMNPSDLLAEIDELWDDLHQMRGSEPSVSPETPTTEPKGAPAMSPSKRELHIGNVENLSIAGDHSAALSGTGHTAHVDHREGADLSTLLPRLQEIAAAINDLGSDKAREALNADARTLKAEVAKGDKADPGVARRALDAIKLGAKVLQEGGKIVQPKFLC